MFDARQSHMLNLTPYSRVRVAVSGAWRVVFGALLGIPAGAFIRFGPNGVPGAPHDPGDMPTWWMYGIGWVLALVSFGFFSAGVGRVLSAFASDCYLRAGAEGVAVRFPEHAWFGRYHVTGYAFRWSELQGMAHFTHRLNLVPIAQELRIQLRDGRTITVDRRLFQANSVQIKEKLAAMQAPAR